MPMDIGSGNMREAVKHIMSGKGSITIEMAVITLLFFSVIFFAVDMGMYFLNKSKVERVNYSLMSLYRERFSVYAEREAVVQDDVDDLAKVAKTLLGPVMSTGMILRVEGLFFKDTSTEENRIVDKTTILTSGAGTDSLTSIPRCFSHLPPLDSSKDMSAWTNRPRYLPVYRITICVPNRMLLLNGFTGYMSSLPENFIISNTALAR